MENDNVIQGRFKQRKEEVWECNCGSQAFLITPYGFAKCFACGSILSLKYILDETEDYE